MEQENFLLNRLDKPLRFLGINKDEALIFIGPLLIGFCTGYLHRSPSKGYSREGPPSGFEHAWSLVHSPGSKIGRCALAIA